MRFLSILIIYLIMALHLVPCTDMEVWKETKIANHHQDKTDQCSPFCYCACCSIPAIGKISLVLNSAYFTPRAPYPVYFTSDFIDISFPIWQPPRFSKHLNLI